MGGWGLGGLGGLGVGVGGVGGGWGWGGWGVGGEWKVGSNEIWFQNCTLAVSAWSSHQLKFPSVSLGGYDFQLGTPWWTSFTWESTGAPSFLVALPSMGNLPRGFRAPFRKWKAHEKEAKGRCTRQNAQNLLKLTV